jgi:glycosyltransferase involved in cell wall biosynthesis
VSAVPSDPVSVVVPTRDVARTLAACLRSVRAQDHQPIELVVVDNASSDDTVEIAQEYADVVLSAGPERSAQRNLGVATATGDWVLWIDADMLLRPDVVSSALAAADRTGAGAVSIPETTVGGGFWTACRALERSCYLDDPSLFNPRLLRRDLLLGVGGFDESMSGPEDADLRLRLEQAGVVVGHATGVIDHDEGRLTLRDVLRKRVYYGASLPTFAAANPGAVRRQVLSTVRAFWRHRRRLFADPLHAGGLVLLRAMEAAGYAVGAVRAARARRP